MDLEGMLESLGWTGTDNQTVKVESAPDSEKDKPLSSTSTSEVAEQQETPVNLSGDAQPGPSQPCTRRRGRRPKSELVNLKPIRQSQRKVRSTRVMEYEEVSRRKRNQWSAGERQRLLEGLEAHGTNNMAQLRDYLPHKSERDIRDQVRLWRAVAAEQLERRLVFEKRQLNCATVNSVAKLDEWIDLCRQLTANANLSPFALANVFSFIAAFSKFPQPEECDGIDFRLMYQYLHSMLNGEPFSGLTAETARALNDSISNTFKIIRELDRAKGMQSFLETHEPLPPPAKSYTRVPNKGPSTSMTAGTILNFPQMNPMNLPPHVLTKPIVEACLADEEDANYTDCTSDEE